MPQSSRNSPSTAHIGIRLFSQLSTSLATAFQFLCTFLSSASWPFQSLTAGFRTLRRYLSCSARLHLIDQFNRIFASATLIFQSFLQLKYQAINDHSQSLFAAHPTAMRVAVASSAVYFLAYGSVLRFPLHRYAYLAHHLLLCSGCIFVASLAAVTLPDTARPFVYAVFGVIAAAGLMYWWRKMMKQSFRRFSRG